MLLGVLVVAAALATWAFRRFGPPARQRRVRAAALAATPVADAATHRCAAAAAGAAGDLEGAVREGFRAVAAELEERGVLAPLPGRTARELAAEAAAADPGLGPDLDRAAAALGAVAYAGRPAGPAEVAAVAAADDAVRRVRLSGVASGAPGAAGAVWAGPRAGSR